MISSTFPSTSSKRSHGNGGCANNLILFNFLIKHWIFFSNFSKVRSHCRPHYASALSTRSKSSSFEIHTFIYWRAAFFRFSLWRRFLSVHNFACSSHHLTCFRCLRYELQTKRFSVFLLRVSGSIILYQETFWDSPRVEQKSVLLLQNSTTFWTLFSYLEMEKSWTLLWL